MFPAFVQSKFPKTVYRSKQGRKERGMNQRFPQQMGFAFIS
jgi:hypothetical protein